MSVKSNTDKFVFLLDKIQYNWFNYDYLDDNIFNDSYLHHIKLNEIMKTK